MDINKILENVERLRKELQDIVDARGSLYDREVIEKSKELDRKLNEYYDFLQKEQEKND